MCIRDRAIHGSVRGQMVVIINKNENNRSHQSDNFAHRGNQYMLLKNFGNQNVVAIKLLREPNGSCGNENMPIHDETRLCALRFTARANHLSISQRTADTC